jgi:ABC-type microcin C transport system permease subunit YejE
MKNLTDGLISTRMAICVIFAILLTIIGCSAAIGYHFGYVEGVVETTADFLIASPSAVCSF